MALAYTSDSRWRNRAEFLTGRENIVRFLQGKWTREQDYRLIKELWAHDTHHIAVRFAYEWHDNGGQVVVSTGTKIGPLMTMALWRSAMRVSTIWPLRRRIDSFYGPESPVAAAALTTIPGFPSWGFD